MRAHERLDEPAPDRGDLDAVNAGFARRWRIAYRVLTVAVVFGAVVSALLLVGFLVLARVLG